MSTEIALSGLIPFNFNGLPVRALTDERGEPWFVAKDICDVLGIVKSNRSIANLDADEKDAHIMSTPGGKQTMAIINEAGFYKLVLRSRKPEASDFQRWVTHEVLPSLRKTGYYSMNQDTDLVAMRESARLLLQVIDRQIKLENRMDKYEQKQKVLAPVPDISPRLQISQVIRSFVARQTSGYSHQDAFDKLYYQFKYRHSIDLQIRAKNAGAQNVMDYAEANGYLEKLLSLAKMLFTEI